MLSPLSERAIATVDAEVVAELMKLMCRKVTPFALLVPTLKGAEEYEMVTSFCDQSAAALAVAPTIVTVAVPVTVTASVYVPARTVTVGIPLTWAALTAAPIAVNCPEPSNATVMAAVDVLDKVAEGVDSVEVMREALGSREVPLEELLWADASPNRAAVKNRRIVIDDLIRRNEWE
jgi:hypothetical protein